MGVDLGVLPEVVKGVLGLAVWVGGVYLYGQYRQDGERGFKRFAAFWVGFPATFGSMVVIREGSREEEERLSVAEEERLLREEVLRTQEGPGLRDGGAGSEEGG